MLAAATEQVRNRLQRGAEAAEHDIFDLEEFLDTVTAAFAAEARFKSVADLEDAIKRYIKAHNKNSKPFVWTASAALIFEKLAEIPEPSE